MHGDTLGMRMQTDTQRKEICSVGWSFGARTDYGLLGRYSGPEVRTWEVSEPETFSMVGIILSQKMYPILCPPYRHIRTAVHSQPHAAVSIKLLFFSSNAENGGFVLHGPPGLGAGGPEFKSGRPDQSMFFVSHHL